MSLSRAGRGNEAKAMLDRRPEKPVTNAYTRRLRLWHLLRGDKAQARHWFERSVQSGGWPAFGFIASEAELKQLR